MSISIDKIQTTFEREPLVRPFGFKGGYMTEIWQTAVMMQSGVHEPRIGIGTQNVLWSDAAVFSAFSPAGGEASMYLLTEQIAQMLKGQKFSDPIQLLDDILEDAWEQGKRLTGNPDLRKTFALNALVAIDNAAWLLYAQHHHIDHFDALIPEPFRPALSEHHSKVASIPLMAYGIPVEEIEQAVSEGYFFMKIKIGQPGTQQEMLEKDKARIEAIHKAIGKIPTEYTENGKIPYYFDANGRYENKETLAKLLDHCEKIGALDQIAIIEEPFPEENEESVFDLGVRIAADESAHTDKDALARIELGYRAMALKPIAKTLSMTLKIARDAHKLDAPCFCADLTVNPILVEWNKNIAGRLKAFPGIDMGLLETNGHQNYRNWKTMQSYHPSFPSPWMQTRNGVFELDDDFYQNSGGIFKPSLHYQEMMR